MLLHTLLLGLDQEGLGDGLPRLAVSRRRKLLDHTLRQRLGVLEE